ncbi:autotransporter-associated beta strand repeat-containing protein [bacterium]|nr:autotransporter-associated beta strand repeat-containing protein [bacterium]
MKTILTRSAALALATITTAHGAEYIRGYSTGTSSQLVAGNGGAGTLLFVDQASTGGGDMVANGGNPTWGWEIDGSATWAVGDKVEFTGIAMPIWANDPTSDDTNNTQNADHRIRIYSCGADNLFDGTANETLLGTVDVTFDQADAGVDEYYVNFDSPIEWASADSTCFYFYIQAINTGSGTAMRFKTGNAAAGSTIKNRTNGDAQTVGGSATTSLSVAGRVNFVERTWFGDNEDDLSTGSADWDLSSANWDSGASVYSEGDFAIFNSSFDGSSGIVNLVGNLSPIGMSVSNAATELEYVFAGTGGLSGPGTLLKSGDGILRIQNTGTNDYSGGTLIQEGLIIASGVDVLPSSGTLSIGSTGGSAEFAMNGFDQSIGSLAGPAGTTGRLVNRSATPTVLTITNGGVYPNQIGNLDLPATDDDNNFSLVKTGEGTLNLDGATNSFNGPTTITGGGVRINTDGALGSAPVAPVADAIVLDGGFLQAHLVGASFELNSNRSITLGAAGGEIRTTTPSGAWNVTYNGVISGPGSLTKSFAQTLNLGGVNTYEGDTIITSGFLGVNGSALPDGGALRIEGGRVRPTGTEVVDSLFFGDIAQAPGTWGATDSGADNIDDTRFVGTAGVVSVTTGPLSSAFQLWAADNISSIDPEAPASFEDDADGDGLDNGLEWILGGNPLVKDSAAVFPAFNAEAAEGITLVFDRNPDATASTTLAVEWGTDLSSFPNSIAIAGNISANGDEPAVAISGDEVTVSIPRANATGGRLFCRLVATLIN